MFSILIFAGALQHLMQIWWSPWINFGRLCRYLYIFQSFYFIPKCFQLTVSDVFLFHAELELEWTKLQTPKLISIDLHTHLKAFRGRSTPCAHVHSVPQWSLARLQVFFVVGTNIVFWIWPHVRVQDEIHVRVCTWGPRSYRADKEVWIWTDHFYADGFFFFYLDIHDNLWHLKETNVNSIHLNCVV